jgi:glutaredoxin
MAENILEYKKAFESQAECVVGAMYSILISIKHTDVLHDKWLNARICDYFWEFKITASTNIKGGFSGTVVRYSCSPEYRNLNFSEKIQTTFKITHIAKSISPNNTSVCIYDNSTRLTVWNTRKCPICNTLFIIRPTAKKIKIYKHSTVYTADNMATHVKSARHIEHCEVYTEMLYETIFTAAQVKLSQDVLNYIVSFM